MANTRKTILDAMASQLQSIDGISKATRVLLTPNRAREFAPYAGLVNTTEVVVVEDSTHVRYEMDVDIILVQRGRDIEELVDLVKNKLYGSSFASTIGALQIIVAGHDDVALIDADSFSSTRIATTITYVSTKGSF